MSEKAPLSAAAHLRARAISLREEGDILAQHALNRQAEARKDEERAKAHWSAADEYEAAAEALERPETASAAG